jgi:hypothetical protein
MFPHKGRDLSLERVRQIEKHWLNKKRNCDGQPIDEDDCVRFLRMRMLAKEAELQKELKGRNK